ncbi:MAG: aminopeptidase P family N-terminal domain-containing protein, partial [Alphaproteobacteria bacterium]
MDFPEAEYHGRLERIQRAMRVRQLDALMCTTGAEMRYFTGFRTLFWESPTRPWFLVIPKDGMPIAIIPEIGAALMADMWIEDICTWSSPDPIDDGVSLLVSALKGCRRIGMPMGRETSLRMSLQDFHTVCEQLPEAEIIDATDVVQSVRMVKSEAEIVMLRTICGIASDAFDAARRLFHIGQSLEEAFKTFKIELLQQGEE